MARNDRYIDEETATETSAMDQERNRRINSEVVILNEGDEDERAEDDGNSDSDDKESAASNEQATKHEKSLIQHIITGSMLTDGTVPYYRYFIAIAVMSFLSIFLTFISLNASTEYRRKERQATMLHERSVVKEEVRYGLSSKRAITERLKQYNVELVDLSNDSRLIEK